MHYFIYCMEKLDHRSPGQVLIRQILGSWENTALPEFLVLYFIPR